MASIRSLSHPRIYPQHGVSSWRRAKSVVHNIAGSHASITVHARSEWSCSPRHCQQGAGLRGGLQRAAKQSSLQLCVAHPQTREGGRGGHVAAAFPELLTAETAQNAVAPVFTTFNAFFLVPFPLMILLPGWEWTKKLMKSPLVPTVAASLFLAELVVATRADYTLPTGAFDSATWQAAANTLLLEAVGDPAIMREFAASTPSYMAQDWLHVCAWDLIGARWIYLDGLERGVWTSHSVFLCQAAGPVGWLAHSLTCGAVDLARRGSNGDEDGDEGGNGMEQPEDADQSGDSFSISQSATTFKSNKPK